MDEDPQRLRDLLTSEQLLVTAEEAAELLRVGRTTVYALIKNGEVHPVHIGRSCRISRAELERYVRRLEVSGACSVEFLGMPAEDDGPGRTVRAGPERLGFT